jgi:hypothetical protein
MSARPRFPSIRTAVAAALLLGPARARADQTPGGLGLLMPPALSLRPAMLAPAVPPPMPSQLGPASSPGQACRQAIRAAERAQGIPTQLMAAIGRVESGRREADGSVNPWPWSINAEGVDHVFDTKAQAIAAVQALQAQGMRSIDVGCMQINLQQHPDAFASLDQAFDPVVNATYAAHFLQQLKDQTGTWPIATAWYHSATPDLGADYERKVMAAWPEEMKQGDAATPVPAIVRPPGAFGNLAIAGYIQPRHTDMGHMLPRPAGTVGRGLDAYRALPIQAQIPLASRMPQRLAPPRDLDGRG